MLPESGIISSVQYTKSTGYLMERSSTMTGAKFDQFQKDIEKGAARGFSFTHMLFKRTRTFAIVQQNIGQ